MQAIHTTTTPWGAKITLSPYASVGRVENALRKAGALHPYDWDYAKDNHFSAYVLGAIQTADDAEAFIKSLEKAALRRGAFAPNSTCAKARRARSVLASNTFDFVKDPGDRARCVFSYVRRTHCGCHETGSFAEYYRGRSERNKFKVLAS